MGAEKKKFVRSIFFRLIGMGLSKNGKGLSKNGKGGWELLCGVEQGDMYQSRKKNPKKLILLGNRDFNNA